ncbi:MAG TPA: AAA family ATPase, partial [Desulfurivibrionaceae bacterium]|nr:AAA family ATPase [Desulfurivibrionaceae bacterium]
DFILERMGEYLETNAVLATPSRLAMMAKQAQAEDLDPREVCDQFIHLVQRILDCAKKISEKCGVTVTFSDDAIDRILAREPRDEAAINQTCDTILQAMEYGLRLLSQKKEIASVVIPAEGIDAPDKFINALVSKAFKVE